MACAHLKSSAGYSLIEASVSMVLISVVTMGASQLITTLTRSSRGLAESGQIEDTLNSLRANLSKQSVCKCNLTPSSPAKSFAINDTNTASFSYSTISTFDSTCTNSIPIINQSSVPDPTKIVINSIKLQNLFRIDDGNYSGSLEIKMTRSGRAQQEVSRTLPIALNTTTSSGTVTLDSCSLGGSTIASAPGAISRATRFGEIGSAKDSGISAISRPVTVESGSDNAAFVVLNSVSPSPNQKALSNLDGIACNTAAGWQMVGCFIAYPSREPDIFPYPNGCLTDMWNESSTGKGGWLSIQCMKRG